MRMNLKYAIKSVRAKQQNEKHGNYVMQFFNVVAPYASSVERIVLFNSGAVGVYSFFMINKRYNKPSMAIL